MHLHQHRSPHASLAPASPPRLVYTHPLELSWGACVLCDRDCRQALCHQSVIGLAFLAAGTLPTTPAACGFVELLSKLGVDALDYVYCEVLDVLDAHYVTKQATYMQFPQVIKASGRAQQELGRGERPHDAPRDHIWRRQLRILECYMVP